MKTSLDHLPSKKQRQLEALAALIRREAEVEMVILFGSHARGDWVEDLETGYFSDFDVAVIVRSQALAEKLKVWSKIEKLGRAITDPTSLTLIVHHIKDVNDQLEKGFYFFSDIKKEGVMLYSSGRYELAESKEHAPEERQRFAQMMFERWFSSAKEFFQGYEDGFGRGHYNYSAFLLHQATERLYNVVLLVFLAYKPKTHNIEDLAKQCENVSPALRDVFPREAPEDKRLFNLLKHAYVDARYNMKYVITADELTAIAARVRDLFARVERVCLERIDAMASEPSAPAGASAS